MRRYWAWAILAVGVLVILFGLFINRRIEPHATAPPPSPTPTEVVAPPPSHASHHDAVRLDSSYKTFVDRICQGLQHHRAGTIENSLEYYQYNEGVYWGTFNLGEGARAPSNLVGEWLAKGSERCVRIAPSYLGHGVVVTRGWRTKHGSWALLDLDKQPRTGAWTIDDFTFGSYRKIMGSFFGNEPKSIVYRTNA